MNAWMLSNPRKPVSIYEVAQFANTAYTTAFSMENAIAGFQKTGIHPFDRNTFTKDDFLTSFVTDRPVVELNNTEVSIDNAPGTSAEILSTNDAAETPAATSSNFTPQIPDSELNLSTAVLSPECIGPYPKALPRKTQNRSRKMKSTVITDTPEEDAFIEKHLAKKKPNQKAKMKTSKNIKKLIQSSSESSDSDFSFHESDTSDDSSGAEDSTYNLPSTSKAKGKSKAKYHHKKGKKNDYDYCTICRGAYLNSNM